MATTNNKRLMQKIINMAEQLTEEEIKFVKDNLMSRRLAPKTTDRGELLIEVG